MLLFSAEKMLHVSVVIVRWLKVPEFLIGATIVALVTSLPELITTFVSIAGFNNSDLAVGNVLGSNCANLGLVFPITVVFSKSFVLKIRWLFDVLFLLFISLLFTFFAWRGELGRGHGLFLLFFLVIYVYKQLYDHRKFNHIQEHVVGLPPTINEVGMLLLSTVGLYFGSRFLVEGAINFARDWGVSDQVIGFTVIAIGTSLPEVVTSVLSIYKGCDDVALGNVVGSNLLNLLFVLGLPLSLLGDRIVINAVTLPYGVMLILSVALLGSLFLENRFQRICGLLMAAIYSSYLIAVFF